MCLASCDGENEHIHSFGEWVTIKKATCGQDGEIARYCECGERQSEILYATGEHVEIVYEAVAPTCTETGLTEGKSCSVCNVVILAQTVINAKGHTEVIDAAVAPTCTATGLTEGKHCSVCNEVIVKQGIAPIVPHSYDDKYDESCNVCDNIRDAECAHKETVVMPGYASTCTEPGLTEGQKCKKCDEVLVHQIAIDATGHTEAIDVPIDPTCTETGLTAGKHCSICTTVLVSQRVVPAIGHAYESEYNFDSSYHWYKCSICNSAKDKAEHTMNNAGNCSVCDQPMAPTEGIIYEKSADGTYAEVVAYTGSATKVKIADTYEGVPVTNIYDNAFKECKEITSVILPNGIINIGDFSFYYCFNLSSIVIPNSVISIGDSAFENCNSLTSIIIPSSVTSIGEEAFYSCDSLVSIEVDFDNEKYKSIDGNLYTKDGKILLQYAIGKTNISFVIPDSVTSIGDSAFEFCSSLTSIVIPDSVTSIGRSAFYGCSNLVSIAMGNNITRIGDCAFSGCRNLTSVIIPDSVASIGHFAFDYCDKLQLNEYENCIYLGKNENPYFALIKVTTNNLSSYTIHADTKIVADRAFANCDRLVSVVIPDGVISVGNDMFYHCDSLSSVVIPDSVINIGDMAFSDCASLTNVVIPNSVTSIGERAFYLCRSLSTIEFEGTITEWNAITKGFNWEYWVPATEVICSDGTVRI